MKNIDRAAHMKAATTTNLCDFYATSIPGLRYRRSIDAEDNDAPSIPLPLFN